MIAAAECKMTLRLTLPGHSEDGYLKATDVPGLGGNVESVREPIHSPGLFGFCHCGGIWKRIPLNSLSDGLTKDV